MKLTVIKAILIHGNGGGKPTDNWLPYLKTELEKMGIEAIAPQFPDAELARASYWLPFLKETLNADSKTIIIGHSSGAIAAMRFAEENQILGSVLVGAYHTDLGQETEQLSGYFDTPWNWDAIKKNQKWIIQFAGTNDPWIPIEEARFVRDKLDTEYHESTGQGHFGGDYYKETFPEAVAAIKNKVTAGSQEFKELFEGDQADNQKVAITYAHQLWNDKDLNAIDTHFHENCVIHSPLGDVYGKQAMKNIVQAWFEGFPTLLVNNIAVLSERDRVAIQWQAKGVHSGKFKGIEPTEKSVSYSGVTIYRIQQNKIVEYWAYLDMNALFDQLRH